MAKKGEAQLEKEAGLRERQEGQGFEKVVGPARGCFALGRLENVLMLTGRSQENPQ